MPSVISQQHSRSETRSASDSASSESVRLRLSAFEGQPRTRGMAADELEQRRCELEVDSAHLSRRLCKLKDRSATWDKHRFVSIERLHGRELTAARPDNSLRCQRMSQMKYKRNLYRGKAVRSVSLTNESC